MVVDSINNTLSGSHPDSLGFTDLDRIGECGLWDKIFERSVAFDGSEFRTRILNDITIPDQPANPRFPTPPGESTGLFIQVLNTSLWMSVVLHSSRKLICTGHVAAKFGSTRPIVVEAACKENFQLARRWFKQYQESHNSCLRSSIDFIPKRLIEIARGNKLEGVDTGWCLRLHHPNSSKVPVEPCIALSYCWGQDRQFKLT